MANWDLLTVEDALFVTVWFYWYLLQRCPSGNICELLSKTYIRTGPSCKTMGNISQRLSATCVFSESQVREINVGHDYGWFICEGS